MRTWPQLIENSAPKENFTPKKVSNTQTQKVCHFALVQFQESVETTWNVALVTASPVDYDVPHNLSNFSPRVLLYSQSASLDLKTWTKLTRMNMESLKRADMEFILQKMTQTKDINWDMNTHTHTKTRQTRQQQSQQDRHLIIFLRQPNYSGTSSVRSPRRGSTRQKKKTMRTHRKDEGANQEETGSTALHFLSSTKLRKSSLVRAPWYLRKTPSLQLEGATKVTHTHPKMC